jgi:predicted transcriptional regulator
MTATAEKIQKDFATLSRGEQEDLLTEFYHQLKANQQDDWPISGREEAQLRAAVDETMQDFRAGRVIAHTEIERRHASWKKPTS